MFTIQPLVPAMIPQYEVFSGPQLREILRRDCLNEKTVIGAASHFLGPAGLVLARIYDNGQGGLMGDVKNLFVGGSYRNNGLGTELLLYVEEKLKEKGCINVFLRFPAGKEYTPAVEKILQKCGWSEPVKRRVYSKYNIFDFKNGWIDRVSLGGTNTAIPWPEISGEKLEEVKKGLNKWYPDWASPFQPHLANPHPATSLWLSHQGQIVGFVITNRISKDTLFYERLFVREDLQKTGLGIRLLAEAIKNQIKEGIPYADMDLAYYPEFITNQHLIRFFEKHCSPGRPGRPAAIDSVVFMQSVKEI
ncbi:MAG: GNAT family N-acetyltransferase [Bacillota bacterium]